MSADRHLVVCYDVPNDRRRARLAQLLKGFLEHVQKSVFEGPLDEGQTARLLRAIPKLVNRNEDAVRIYSLCRHCRGSTEVVGVGLLVSDESEDLVI